MMIPVYQIEILKKARDKAETEDKSLFNALSIAIIRLENHVCPNLKKEEPKPYTPDYWDTLYGGETQTERFGK